MFLNHRCQASLVNTRHWDPYTKHIKTYSQSQVRHCTPVYSAQRREHTRNGNLSSWTHTHITMVYIYTLILVLTTKYVRTTKIKITRITARIYMQQTWPQLILKTGIRFTHVLKHVLSYRAWTMHGQQVDLFVHCADPYSQDLEAYTIAWLAIRFVVDRSWLGVSIGVASFRHPPTFVYCYRNLVSSPDLPGRSAKFRRLNQFQRMKII